MHRFVAAMSIVLLAVMMIGSSASAQQAAGSAPLTVGAWAGSDAVFPDKAELMRRIALYEAAEQSAERTHLGMESMVKIYSNLAALYEDTNMYAKAEPVMRREISMLRNGPQNELADAIGHLAVLHIA